MLTAFQKLEKILKLEESQGYKDRAVIGGFAKFASIWQSEAQADARNPEQQQAAGEIADMLAGYAEAEAERREQMVNDILNRLQGKPESEPEQRWPPPVKPGSTQSKAAEPAPPVAPPANDEPQAPVPAPATPAPAAAPPPERPATGLE
ncbi:MAG TPA: hypothetical protein VLC52_00655, partial [Anaerolineae bacterium]|nr:hypothetical protein [Anaerolineae bacterium]